MKLTEIKRLRGCEAKLFRKADPTSLWSLYKEKSFSFFVPSGSLEYHNICLTFRRYKKGCQVVLFVHWEHFYLAKRICMLCWFDRLSNLQVNHFSEIILLKCIFVCHILYLLQKIVIFSILLKIKAYFILLETFQTLIRNIPGLP